MKLFIVVATFVCYVGIISGCNPATLTKGSASLVAFDGRVPKETYKLSTNAKKPSDAPVVTFNHANHSTKNYSVDGTKTIGCTECHHTDQPAAEAAKHPPLKTAHPADRTTTLTADLLSKDAKAPDVVACQSCHAQEGAKPKIGAEIPKVTYEGDTDATVLTNEIAYHRNCNTCHDLAAEARKNLKLPTSQQCAECHTGK
ncbi:MAG TPA: cytochrome c3 family protein [Pyrinomonadaceae bacterium]|jgi:cytochrome c553|nr:cytochrome c3 family protein [Pyrinomonadaceae bacterium]